MIDALVLRTRVVELLDGMLGQYKFSDRTTGPAIAILPDDNQGFNYPGNGTDTDGLECVILRPYPSIKQLLGSDRIKTYHWSITLKQWNSAGSLLEATEALVDGLNYFTTSPEWVPPNQGLGIIEQVRLEIIEYELSRTTASLA